MAAPTPSPSTPSKKKMHTDSPHAVVRLLPSAGLEGAFRVHFLPDSLREAGLKIGDVCEISCDDGTAGYGIAWQAADSMGNRPKTRPAKMTETFKTAFGFQDGSKVAICQTDAKIYPADSMVLSDVTPTEYSSANDMDSSAWEIRIKNLFLTCEALAPGISFDITGRNKKSRKRFFIESIEGKDAPSDSPSLFSFEGRTRISFPGGINAPASVSPSNPHRYGSIHMSNAASSGAATNCTTGTPQNRATNSVQFQLDMTGVGGLLEECAALNRHLRCLLAKAEELNSHASLVPNNPLLIHGYEGTGKSLLLKKVAQAPFRKVLRIDRSNLPGGTISANKKFIKETFAEAISEQPALILFDNLDQLAPTDDTHYSDIIASEIEAATKPGDRVVIVGACRKTSNVNAALIGPHRFSITIEMPVPNLEAREQILNVLQGKPTFTKDTLSTAIAEQTHGYTARDVTHLYQLARYRAYHRFGDEDAEPAMGRSPTPPSYDDVVSRLDGSDVPFTRRDAPSTDPTLKDFEAALEKVKPTALREIFTEKPKTTWADICGSDLIKQQFDEAIDWPLRYKDMMIKLGIKPPKGVLMYGPPGCSKTLTAQAVANTYKLNFIAINGAELISMYVGESERAVREVFRKARQAAPCVIFFDEIDSIGSERDSTGTKGLHVLTTLLTEMDGFKPLKDVFILAATNKPGQLDPALRRAGRFDRHIYLGPPSEAARKEILMLTTRGTVLAKDVDFGHLAAQTEGYSGAEIVRICEDAKTSSFRKARSSGDEARVSAADFASAMAGVKRSITREMLDEFDAFA